MVSTPASTHVASTISNFLHADRTQSQQIVVRTYGRIENRMPFEGVGHPTLCLRVRPPAALHPDSLLGRRSRVLRSYRTDSSGHHSHKDVTILWTSALWRVHAPSRPTNSLKIFLFSVFR